MASLTGSLFLHMCIMQFYRSFSVSDLSSCRAEFVRAYAEAVSSRSNTPNNTPSPSRPTTSHATPTDAIGGHSSPNDATPPFLPASLTSQEPWSAHGNAGISPISYPSTPQDRPSSPQGQSSSERDMSDHRGLGRSLASISPSISPNNGRGLSPSGRIAKTSPLQPIRESEVTCT